MTSPEEDLARPGQRGVLAGRTASRLGAVQALYQMALGGQGIETVIDEFLEDRLQAVGGEPEQPDIGQVDEAFFDALVRGVSGEAEPLDDMLSAVLVDGWPVERLELLLKLILRAGAFELGHWPEVPARVVVSQYVDLAHAFLDDKQTAMANGVLDQLARSLRPEEFDGGADASTQSDDAPHRAEPE
jgi:N utilization substance protein B